MEKEIFFLFNPDAPEMHPVKKEAYRSALPKPTRQNISEKKVKSFKLHATICSFFNSIWWN